MPETFFRLTNTVALLAWIGLVCFPGRKAVSERLCAVIVPAALSLAYVGVIGWRLATTAPAPADPTTLAGLRTIFGDDWILAAAWTHYLVFDMVTGAWIARDAVRLRMPAAIRTVALVLTFLAGPAGFLLHVAARRLFRGAVDVDDGRPSPSDAVRPHA